MYHRKVLRHCTMHAPHCCTTVCLHGGRSSVWLRAQVRKWWPTLSCPLDQPPPLLPGGGWLVFPCHQIAADLCPDWDRGTQLDLISSWKIWHNCTSIGNANKVGCYWSRPQLSSWCSRSRPQLRKWSPAFPAPLTKSGFSLRNIYQNCWQALQYGVNAQFLLCFYQSR